MSKKFLYGPLAVGAVILAVWYGIWLQGAKHLKTVIAEFAVESAEDGAIVTYDHVRVSGFPFFLRGEIDKPNTKIASGDIWRGDKLYMDADIVSPRRLIFSPRGRHQFLLRSGDNWSFIDDSARASFEKFDDDRWIAKFAGDYLKADITSGETAHLFDYLLNVQRVSKELDIYEASAVSGAGAIDGGIYDGKPVSLDRIEFAARLYKASLLNEDTLDQWRQEGGRLEINRAIISNDGAFISVSGKVSVDPEGYITGDLNAIAQNPAKLTPLIAAFGQLSEQETEATRATLLMMGIATGGKIEAPIKFKEGKASLLGIQIGTLPKYDLNAVAVDQQ